MSTHTKTPWLIVKQGGSSPTALPTLIINEEGKIGYIELERDAKYMVKCVNSHDELVQVIKDTLQIMEGSNFNTGYLKQALQKAESED